MEYVDKRAYEELRAENERLRAGIMNDNIIERAAKLRKIVILARMPGMDAIAVKLNCDPTWDEGREARMWAKAFELAKSDRNTMDCVFELAKEMDKY